MVHKGRQLQYSTTRMTHLQLQYQDDPPLDGWNHSDLGVSDAGDIGVSDEGDMGGGSQKAVIKCGHFSTNKHSLVLIITHSGAILDAALGGLGVD